MRSPTTERILIAIQFLLIALLAGRVFSLEKVPPESGAERPPSPSSRPEPTPPDLESLRPLIRQEIIQVTRSRPLDPAPVPEITDEMLDILSAIENGTVTQAMIERGYGLLSRTKRYDEAVDLIEPVINEKYADRPEAFMHLSQVHVMGIMNAASTNERRRHLRGAIRAFDRVLELDPEHYQARFQKAFYLAQFQDWLGQRAASVEHFEQIIGDAALYPPKDVADVCFHLGMVYQRVGNAGKAREAWERGLGFDPDQMRIIRELALLDD